MRTIVPLLAGAGGAYVVWRLLQGRQAPVAASIRYAPQPEPEPAPSRRYMYDGSRPWQIPLPPIPTEPVSYEGDVSKLPAEQREDPHGLGGGYVLMRPVNGECLPGYVITRAKGRWCAPGAKQCSSNGVYADVCIKHWDGRWLASSGVLKADGDNAGRTGVRFYPKCVPTAELRNPSMPGGMPPYPWTCHQKDPNDPNNKWAQHRVNPKTGKISYRLVDDRGEPGIFGASAGGF